MVDTVWQPSVDVASGMAAYYREREAHERKLAKAAYRQWQEHFGQEEKFRILAETAEAIEGPASRPAGAAEARAALWL